jgi:hypothetical protein
MGNQEHMEHPSTSDTISCKVVPENQVFLGFFSQVWQFQPSDTKSCGHSGHLGTSGREIEWGGLGAYEMFSSED